MIDRVEALQADIDRAPEALRGLLDVYLGGSGPLDDLDPTRSGGRRVAFVGFGSSYFAALDVAHALRTGGVPAWATFASVEAAPPSRDLVLVAVSASGSTPEVVETARRHRGRSLVIGVTNSTASPLAAEVDIVLPLLAGTELSGISTLTYRASVAVLGLLAGRLGADLPDARDLSESVDRLEAIRDAEDDGVAGGVSAAADLLDHAAAIDVIGPAERLGAVSQAALMLREAPRLPAHPHESADWLHTAVYLAIPGHRAILATGAAADAEVLETIHRRGGKVVSIGPGGAGAAVTMNVPMTDPRYRTIVESALIDRLALELWRRASRSG